MEFETGLIRRNKILFREYTQIRRRYAYNLNAEKAAVAFELIPALLTLDESDLPGYVGSGETGCGVYGVGSARDLKKLIEKYFPETKDRPIPYQKYLIKRPIVETLFVMGSIGTIAQTEKSDFDFWVCVKTSLFDKGTIEKLEEKTRKIAAWCERRYDMEVHFFVSDLERVRNNDFGSVDEESTGSSQKRFLKEECYRTMLLVSGKIPIWWVLPPGISQEEYDRCQERLRKEAPYDFNEFVDLGFLGHLSKEEFLGTALWQLSKGIKDPFKALLKMGMMEWYLSEAFDGKLLCDLLKERVLAGPKGLRMVDPYQLMVETVLDFYSNQGREDAVDLVRKAFYVKAKPDMTRAKLKRAVNDHKEETFADLMKSWDWSPVHAEELNRMESWSYASRLKMSTEINRFFFSTYRRLSEAQLLKERQAINNQDLTLLARKIYVLFARHQKKLQLNPSLSGQRPVLDKCIFQFRRDTSGKTRWALYDATRYPAEQSGKVPRIFTAGRIVKAATWLVVNGIFDRYRTIIEMPFNPSGVILVDLVELLRSLEDFFPQNPDRTALETDLREEAKYDRIMVVVDIEDVKGKNGPRSIDLVCRNTWGEVFTEAYPFQTGLSMVRKYVEDLKAENPAEMISRVRVHVTKDGSEDGLRKRVYQTILTGLVEQTPSPAY